MGYSTCSGIETRENLIGQAQRHRNEIQSLKKGTLNGEQTIATATHLTKGRVVGQGGQCRAMSGGTAAPATSAAMARGSATSSSCRATMHGMA